MRRSSLRTQLILWNVVILALLLGALGFAVRYMVTTSLRFTVESALDRQINKMPPPPNFFGGDDWRDDFDRMRPPSPPRNRATDAAAVTLEPRHFDLNGKSMGRSALDQDSIQVVLKTGQRDTRRILVGDDPMQVLSAPIIIRGKMLGVEQVGYRLTEIEEAERGLDRALLMLLPLGLISAAGAGFLLTSRVLGRIRETTTAARQMTMEGPSEMGQLPVSGNDEFSELANVLNDLLIQQQRALEQQRRFTADASHELKSPLTVIKGTTGMALESQPPFTDEQYRSALQQIGSATDTMVGLVQDLLLLARSDSWQLGQNQIEVLLSEVLERAVKITPSEGAPIVLELSDPALLVKGNEGELIRLFTNLLDNARRHTPESGQVRVLAESEGEEIVIRVQDTGEGIAPEHLPHLGERFYRVDSARARDHKKAGSGLGLSISKAIVTAHSGTLEIDSEPEKGTTVMVRLPQPILETDELS